MAVSLADLLQALLCCSPPSFLRGDYYDAARPHRFQQRLLWIAGEKKHDLRGLHTSRYLAGLLTKDIE